MTKIDGEKIKLDALRGGDSAKEAFSELWNYFYPRLTRFASSFKGLPVSEYDDHVSDILIKVFQKIAGYNPSYSISTWIYTIAENHFNDVLRKTKRNASISLDDLETKNAAGFSADSAIADEAAECDLLERCKKAIAMLRDDDQKIAFLKFYESMSSSEIGKILGIPPGSVRWRISMIRSFIEKHTGVRDED